MASLVGKWKQVDRTNIEGFLKLLEVPEEKKAKATENAKNLTVEITYEGGAINLTLTTPTATNKVTLIKGKDCEYTSSHGKKMLVNTQEITDNTAKAILKSADGSKDWGTLETCVSGDTLKATMILFEIESVSTLKKM